MKSGNAESPPRQAGQATTVVNLTSMRTARYVLFSVGHIRFALASTDIASLTREPDSRCEYVSSGALVPRRYHDRAQIDARHDYYIHLAGCRLGISACRCDGAATLESAKLSPVLETDEAPWIVATLAHPPSLVLDKRALIARLHACSVA